MIIVETQALENGAHRNQITGASFKAPEGWILVPEELEVDVMLYLPFIVLEIEDGVLIGVSQGEIPPYEPPELPVILTPQDMWAAFMEGYLGEEEEPENED